MIFYELGVLFVVFLFASKALADKSVTFKIITNGQYMRNCNSSDVTLNVNRNETIDVTVQGYTLHYPSCSLSGEDSSKILGYNNFEKNMTTAETTYLAKVKTDHLKTGRWNCTFLILEDIKRSVWEDQLYVFNNHTYTRVSCTVWVDVAEAADSVIRNESKILNVKECKKRDTIYYIAGGCVIGLIVIGQFTVIIYLKRKSANATKLQHIQRTPKLERDDARYSVGPGQRKNSRKNIEEDLYVSVDELLQGPNDGSQAEVPKSPTASDIMNRPPMPLPMDLDSSDDGHISNGGNTFNKKFSPEPPPIETLPRNRGKKNCAPNPASKPINTRAMKSPKLDMEHYDYADNNVMANTDSLNRTAMKGKKGGPKVSKKPVANPQESPRLANAKPIVPGGALLMSELSNKLENDIRNRSIAYPKRPVAERAPNVQANWQQSAGRGKAREMTPPDAKAFKSFSTPKDVQPRPQETSFHEPARPHDAGLPFAPRPLKSPDVTRNRGPPMAMISPMQANVAPPVKKAVPPKPRAIAKPLPPPPQSDEIYEPIDDNTDDEEFDKMEDLTPFSLYVNSVSLVNRHRHA